MRLVTANLQHFEGVLIPGYDRTSLRPGIVHIGIGNFHRAHQAWYLHRLMQQGLNYDWAIIGAGIKPYDAKMRSMLLTQDYLTTLISLGPAEKSAEVIGAMIDYLPVTSDHSPLIQQISHPDIRIVSLTITEGGYYLDAAAGAFNTRHPDIQHDVVNPDQPKTVFGIILSALKLRYQQGYGPITLLSCDNLSGNGRILRQALVGLAQLVNPSLAAWIDTNCSFPNTMVDCIVPATGATERNLVRTFGIFDQVPVTHENFRQWVIEDKFCQGRPDWQEVGVSFVSSTSGYEQIKMRMLNGGHQVIAAAGDLLGCTTIAAVMANPILSKLFAKVLRSEIMPHVKPVPEYSLEGYLKLIIKRFTNANLADTTRRVAFDGSSRQSGFILPSIRDGLARGQPVTGLALTSAIWAYYCAGKRVDGTAITANDPNWSQLHQRAIAAKENPLLWLENRDIYGNLAAAAAFSKPFQQWLKLIYSKGLTATIQQYTDTKGSESVS